MNSIFGGNKKMKRKESTQKYVINMYKRIVGSLTQNSCVYLPAYK